ncbi:MAG TPA: GTP-binding protein [Gammaproteobacteria bacterium]|nr:GTP-binding protein [Gammaproteobacteria bacterium]
MAVKRRLKIVMIAVILLLMLLAMLLVTWVTGAFLQLWQQLEGQPTWVMLLYAAVILLLVMISAAALWWLLRPSRKRVAQTADEQPPSREELEKQLQQAQEQGISTAKVEQELKKLQHRKEAGVIHIALFGEISSGKSTLIKALLPDAQVEISARGGSTREINEYYWRSAAGDELVLTDMPGLNEAQGSLDQVAAEEAQRSHIVIFVTNGDLTRTEYDAMNWLQQLKKPLLLVINKAEWFSREDLQQLHESIQARFAGLVVVDVTASGEELVIRLLPDGSEERVMRPRPPRVEKLAEALQQIIDTHREVLDELRDSAVFVLAQTKLHTAINEERALQAEKVVSTYTKRAVVGAMAAVAPGTDLLIQGFLATRMIKALSTLYEVPAREADTELLIELVQKHVGKTTALILAIAGNGLKAFPGVGTLAGGLLHAVAYGMIFNTLGHAVASSLQSRGELRPLVASQHFKEHLGDDLEASAKRYAKMAIKQLRD